MTTDSQIKIANSIGIPVARRHIFLCADQTKPKCCDKERGIAAWDFLKKRLHQLGLSDQGGILRTKACGINFRVQRFGPHGYANSGLWRADFPRATGRGDAVSPD